MRRTLCVLVEDRPGVLARVVSLFRRRGYNIESLTVGRTERTGVSRVTIVVRADADTARRLEANLYKLVNVLLVDDVTESAAVVRELALIKVRADGAVRAEILQICDVFRGRAVDVSDGAVTVEVTGAPDKIDGLLAVLERFGVVELLRTGAVAMARGPAAAAEAIGAEAGSRERAA